MRREPQMWLRAGNQTWYVKLDGRQVPLGKDEAEARKEYHRLLSCRVVPDRTVDAPVANIVNAFLEWERKTAKSARTVRFYEYHLLPFIAFIGDKKLSALRRDDVYRFVEQTWPDAGAAHRRNAVRAIKRAFSVAEEREWIDRNPVAKVKAETVEARDCDLTPEQALQVWSALDDSDFSDAIRFLILTGARPYEMRTATAGLVNREAHAITFSREGSKGKKRRRTVILSDAAFALVERRLAKSGGSFLFTNEAGRPWTADALNCGCRRLTTRLRKTDPGFPRVFCYLFRYAWATDSLVEAEVSPETVAKLMGHTAGSAMLSTKYSRVGRRGEYLRSVANKIDEARRLA